MREKHRGISPVRASCVAVEDATALYRHFDAEGRLLYVGISLSAVDRLSKHKVRSRWFRQVATVAIEWHPSREAAKAAERAAVQAERPTHNVLLTGRPKVNWAGRDGVIKWARQIAGKEGRAAAVAAIMSGRRPWLGG